jgi:hypothetical protein
MPIRLRRLANSARQLVHPRDCTLDRCQGVRDCT